jgi:hypothetical protein
LPTETNERRCEARPANDEDGTTISTLADARDYALSLPNNINGRNEWQCAAELMLEAAKGGGVYEASLQIRKALFLNMRLDVTKTPA